jgi:hypothetical protein
VEANIKTLKEELESALKDFVKNDPIDQIQNFTSNIYDSD